MNKKNSFGSRLFMGLVFLFLYAPILLLIVFSFNAGNSSAVWKGFSLKWYVELFQDRLIMQSVYTTLLVSVLATLIATVAGTFAAIGFYTADIQVRKIIIRTAFLSRDADFGRSRVVVHFDEETGHQFFCLVACQRTVGNPLFVERSQMLVEMAGIHRVPTVQFGDRS